GAWRYRGLPGLGFAFPPTAITTSSHPVSDILFADLDVDGKKECVVSCRDLDCLSVFTQLDDGTYAFVLSMDAPASRFLATGDLDGDGKPDLIGSGRILWTALSSHAPQTTPPLNLTGQRPRLGGIVINEFLANNTAFNIDSDGDRFVEWVEIYNASPTSRPLNGWKLRCVAPSSNGQKVTNDFTFPPVAFSPSGKYTLVYFSETKRTLYHTGFKFPAEGGTLLLLDASGHEVDKVEYPAQRENVSYCRYRDALHSFVFSAFPSPGKPNIASGVVTPTLNFAGVDPLSLVPGNPIRFFAEANADFGISSITMNYQRLDDPNSIIQQIPFYDDGQHGDGGISDSVFTGDLVGSLPPGAEIQFFFEMTDLDENVTQVPEEPEFGLPGLPGNVFQLAMTAERPALELSEVVPSNYSGLQDELGGYPDWVEVRNTSSTAIRMDRIFLSHQLGDNTRFFWPTGSVLQPGEHSVVFFDNRPAQGSWHAPLRLNREGDTVFLSGQTTNNSPFLIDWVQFGRIESDVALGRLGAGGDWKLLNPTPGFCNAPGGGVVFVNNNEVQTGVTFAFPTTRNTNYIVEFSSSLSPGVSWSTIETCTGDGLEKLVTRPVASAGFFRVRKQ
ncbi:MAG TPA: lamin tail domain-containing protein, partial [Candidatus Saccharimonadales bacterium]|nr:lamin tail domain-containing protein [Candidatus Saccharimonadales bacterium]